MLRARSLALAILLIPALVWPQVSPPEGGGGTFDGGSVTNPTEGPDGCAAPAWSFTADPLHGLCNDSTFGTIIQHNVLFSAANASFMQLNTGSAGIGTNDGTIQFTGVTATAATNLLQLYAQNGVRMSVDSNSINLISQALAADQSAAQPSYSFTNNDDTGMYYASDSVRFSINNNFEASFDAGGLYLDDGGEIEFEGATPDANHTILTVADPSGTNTLTLPDKSGTVATLADVGGGWTYVTLVSDFVTSATTPQDTNLKFTPVAGTDYIIEAFITAETNNTSYGQRPGVKWPTAGADNGAMMLNGAQTAASNLYRFTNAGVDIDLPISGAATVDVGWPFYIQGSLETNDTTVTGDFIITFHGENAGGSYTLLSATSWLRYREQP